MLESSQDTFVPKELDLGRIDTITKICLEGPKRLGYFCYNEVNKSIYCQDRSSLRYLDLPDPVSIDCLQGYDPKIKYEYKHSKSSNLMHWILESESIVNNFTYEFICNNGLLKDIMTFPYYNSDWNLSAARVRGKIVLSRIESNEKIESAGEQFEKLKKSAYAAFNLQKLITKSNNCSELDSGKEENSFFGVFHSKIGSHQILHSGYLDCVESEPELTAPFDDMRFVLIKKINPPRESQISCQANTWWSLATLAGIDTVIRAKCEEDFTVKNIVALPVNSLISKQRQMIFFAALNATLDHIKSIVTEENKCYNFYFNVKEKKSTGYVKMDLDENLIPSWYIDGKLPDKVE